VKTFDVFKGESQPWQIEATAFAVSDSGHIVFWREGAQHAVLSPKEYRLVIERDEPKT